MIQPRDIYWLAGLLEGEAWFGYAGTTPIIDVGMADQDVINRASTILGIKQRKPWKRKDEYKTIYSCAANGRRAIGWMMTLYALMGERRQEQIRKALDKWKAQPRTTHASRGNRSMAQCHPDRPVVANWLCRNCYMRDYRKRTGKNGTFYRQKAVLA